MKTFFIDLWNDPAKFTACARSLLFMVGSLIQIGVIPLPDGVDTGWPAALIPVILNGGALAIPAGQTNVKEPK